MNPETAEKLSQIQHRKGKLYQSLLLVANLLFINFLSMQFLKEPEWELYLIIWRIALFIFTVFITGAMIHYFKPKIIKIIITPIFLAAFLFAMI